MKCENCTREIKPGEQRWECEDCGHSRCVDCAEDLCLSSECVVERMYAETPDDSKFATPESIRPPKEGK